MEVCLPNTATHATLLLTRRSDGEISVTKGEAIRAGMSLDPDSLVLYPEKYGGGVYTSIEWNHQLHCLVSPSLLGRNNDS